MWASGAHPHLTHCASKSALRASTIRHRSEEEPRLHSNASLLHPELPDHGGEAGEARKCKMPENGVKIGETAELRMRAIGLGGEIATQDEGKRFCWQDC